MKVRNISFKGINNLKLAKKEYSNLGFYQKSDNVITHGQKNYTELHIDATLTDDEKGSHLSDYLKKVPYEFINQESPDTIHFNILKIDIPKDNLSYSFFKLNNKNLIIDNNKKLAIMTFLARLTRESSKNPEFSIKKRQYLNLANKSISKEAVEYIER